MSIERLVTILTPTVFAPAAAFIVAWFGAHFPGGPALDPLQVTALFALGFTGACTLAHKWLTGRQAFTNPPKVVVNQVPAPTPEPVEVPDVASIVDSEIAKADVAGLVKAQINEVLSRGLVTGPDVKPVAKLVPVEPDLQPDPPAAA